MSDVRKIAFVQFNPSLGDIPGNGSRIEQRRNQAWREGAEIVVFPEMALSGYIAEDLVQKPVFLDTVQAELERLAALTEDGPALIIGAPLLHEDTTPEMPAYQLPAWKHWRKVTNSAVVMDGGKITAVRHKVHLPDEQIFDDARTFEPGGLTGPVNVRGLQLGLCVCEDIWWDDVPETLAECGADILLALNGSPFGPGKNDSRIQMAVRRATEHQLPVVYLNQTGGQDDLPYDGGSFVLNADCQLAGQMRFFTEQTVLTEWTRGPGGWTCAPGPVDAPPSDEELLWLGAMTGLKDYVHKNGFGKVILGLSGGIDSAITAIIAADALGPENVHAVMLPSPYTSQDSLDDAAALAQNLGIRLDTVPISAGMEAVDSMLAPLFADAEADLTEENIQSRLRGLTLMALSNKFGALLLTTGNKSEIAVGYATLYGDMCGAYNCIGDLYKSQVFALSEWRNGHHPCGAKSPAGEVMPQRIITKPPSAELRPDQKDSDSLPDYDVLDPILKMILEEERSPDEIVQAGYDRATVLRVWRLTDIAEYKRRQAAPAVRLSDRGFGKDRRYPMTNGFRVS